jgi:endo-1,4-beta-xylanase
MILITELDVLDVEFTPAITARDADVAALYRIFLDTVLDERAVKAIVTWGLVDRYSWYNMWYDNRFSRWDRQPARPLLFDNSLHPKPAYFAVLGALRRAEIRTHK